MLRPADGRPWDDARGPSLEATASSGTAEEEEDDDEEDARTMSAAGLGCIDTGR